MECVYVFVSELTVITICACLYNVYVYVCVHIYFMPICLHWSLLTLHDVQVHACINMNL